ncbi:GH116 family glycosyl-hydrolase [Nonomuraea harbinensis]|uniref:GH116 family glycosyl-hydrolase n=1 Tax=Nonomuraea harbinensis TaxID=1286938 RepID=A0ABW1C2G8_9ACTN|nr:GH116 family glycosyl-hydrolase [Nonomuraea harbinensis]
MNGAARPIPHGQGRHVAMPLGGIGTGNLAIGADGGLRQWQLQNCGNHRGVLPYTFFALRVSTWEPPANELFVLQARSPDAPATPLVNDDHVPAWQRDLLRTRRGVSGTTFRGLYPFAHLEYHGLPVEVGLEAFNPLVPLDVDDSSLPVALFTFTIANPGPLPAQVWLAAAAQDPVGHDGTTPIDGVRGLGYGGNVNSVRRAGGWTSLVMENPGIDPASPGAGQMVLTVDAPDAAVLPQWTHPDEFLAFVAGRAVYGDAERARHASWQADYQASGPRQGFGPSPAGLTWNGGVVAPMVLAPGETRAVRLCLAWYFPNRYANFVQFGPPNPRWGPTRFWLGNAYATRFADALDVAAHVRERWTPLRETSLRWVDVLADSSLPAQAAEHLAAQASIPRSPSCFRTADGAFFGFEGVLGASTVMWSGDVGGSCPLNCTHVWNYAQAVARLFPSLERSMRATEYEVMQAPEGYLPHRVIAPTYLRQLWDVPIGGPVEPALDGMLGAVLKTYREVRHGAPLEPWWPGVKRLLGHVRATWDPEGSGVLHGVQPSTHDIDLCGLNPFMGTLWLAALRAAEEMAVPAGEPGLAAELRELFDRGSARYDEALFNGSYYVQVLEEGDSAEFQWLEGCLADQLIGQWWAHQLGLGHLLPREHVVSALRAIVGHNLRTGFRDFDHPYRVFADEDDTGLLMCTWPLGGRPAVPTRYCDEVWTGSEYQVAAHCLWEGLEEEAQAILAGLWRRYDGGRRNPYNEIECGDHYVRAMAGWSVLDALAGASYDATSGRLTLAPRGHGRWPLLLPTGWGTLVRDAGGARVVPAHGELRISEIICH